MEYTANDIVSLSAGAAFRTKLGMYLSADKQEAINLGLRELIVNVQDEYEVYKPDNPSMSIYLDTKTKLITVKDNMRGIPVGIRDDGINSLTAAFLIPHSGGKHESGAYQSAIGVNGEGNKIVCHTAKWLKVTVHRDNKIYRQEFKSNDDGAQAVTEVEVIGTCNDTGTQIEYVPDEKVYGDCFINIEKLEDMLTEISYFTKGLNISLYVDGKKKKDFISKNGLVDGLDNKNSISKPFSYFYETPDCKVELALEWVSKGGNIKGYANGLYMPDGGAFISGFKSSLTRTFNSVAKSKFSGESIRNVLSGFVSVKVKIGQFSNQAKTALANPEARTATSTAISNAIKEFAQNRKKDFDEVIELLQKIEKAERAADRARQQILQHEKDMIKAEKAVILNPDKLRDARKLGQNSTLLIVEGNSAGGSMSIGRDPEKYGILMLRGKALNLISNTIEDALNNEEVILLLQALGITYGKPYNSSKLRYGKVAIASDADFDGSHIGLLIMGMLYTLCPDFLKENRLYWLKAPIYKIECGKNNYYYYTEDEFQNRKNINGNIIKYKGLGQMGEQDLKESMFNLQNQHMEPIIYTPAGAQELCELMGKDSTPKKNFVMNNIDFREVAFE